MILLNLLLAIILGWLALYLCERSSKDWPFAVVVGLIVGFLIYSLHLVA